MHTAVMLRSCSVPSILLLLLPLATALRVGTGASSPLLRSAGVSRCASPHCTVATTAPAAAAPSDEVTDNVCRKLDFDSVSVAYTGENYVNTVDDIAVAMMTKEEQDATHTACGCEFCRRAKMTYAWRKRGLHNAETCEPGELLIGDLCTTLPLSTGSETTLFVIRDVGSRLLFAIPVRSKHPKALGIALTGIRKLLEDLRTELGLPNREKIWTFHSDDGGEFR